MLQIYGVNLAYTPSLSVLCPPVNLFRVGVAHQRCSMLSLLLRNDNAMYIETSLARSNRHASLLLMVTSGPYERNTPHVFC